jgi:spermidine/putrescine transport system ATP-binding protein
MHPEPVVAVGVEGISKSFGGSPVLRDVSLEIRKGEFLALLGPSGCGKSTLLRIISGLEQADKGRVTIGGKDASSLPPNRRPVNTVFQSYALFPHLSVFDNVAFGLRMDKVPSDDIKRRVQAALELVKVEALASRLPAQLSGGQQQRVALARALVKEPDVVLLDEPLAALDYHLRKELQRDLHALQRRVGSTFIFVTHDQEEAFALSDRVALLEGGRIVQVGTPRDLYNAPAERFVSAFIGDSVALEGEFDGRAALKTAAGTITVPALAELQGRASKAVAVFRPEDIDVDVAGASERQGFSRVEGKVVHQVFEGPSTRLLVESNGAALTALVASSNPDNPTTGQTVSCFLPIDRARVFPV